MFVFDTQKKENETETHYIYSGNLQEFAGTFLQVCSFNFLVSGLFTKHVVFVLETQKQQKRKRNTNILHLQQESAGTILVVCFFNLLVAGKHVVFVFEKQKKKERKKMERKHSTPTAGTCRNLQQHSCWSVRLTC